MRVKYYLVLHSRLQVVVGIQVRFVLQTWRTSGKHKTFVRDGVRKKTRQTEEEVGRQHQGMDRP